MNELKYRVWDKEVGKYCDSFAVHLKGYYLGYSTTFGDYSALPDEMNDRFIVERRVGIADKTGTDVYEGDMVKVHYLGLKNDVFTVKFGEYQSDKYHFLCWYIENDTDKIPFSLAVPCNIIGNVNGDSVQ